MPALDAARSKIISSLAASAANGVATLPIRRRADGDFIGYCGLVTGRATLAEPEIAYERGHSTWDEHGEIVWNVREL